MATLKFPFAAEAAPQILLPPLPSLAPAALDYDRVRRCLAVPPAWTQETTDEMRAAASLPALRPAAVLVPLVVRDAGLSVLLTRRSADLPHHAGQISFPGGAVDAGDRDPVATALRETYEETGLAAEYVEIATTLPDYLTRTGFRIVPVVGFVRPPPALCAAPGEVAEIFEVPLPFLMDPRRHQLREVTLAGKPHRFYAMPYRSDAGSDYFIWGATAGMLRNLYHLLAAGCR